MHLRQLDLGLGADTLWEGSVADEVSESLPKDNNRSANCLHILNKASKLCIMLQIRACTFLVHSQRKLFVSCDPECCGC